MKIQINIVGVYQDLELEWPEDFPVPQINQEIQLSVGTLFVRHVVWYPSPDPDGSDGSTEPFVYVVIGPRYP